MACSTEALERAVDRFQKGDDEEVAFRLIFNCYFPVFRRFYAKKGVPAEDCYDLAQTTLVQVLRNLTEFRRESSFKTWISTIAFNSFKRWLRQKKKRDLEVSLEPTEPSETQSQEPEDPELSLDEALMRRQRRQRLRRCLEELSARQRMSFVLYTYDDLSYKEIAARMNIEVGTVGALLSQARKKVGESLEEEWR